MNSNEPLRIPGYACCLALRQNRVARSEEHLAITGFASAVVPCKGEHWQSQWHPETIHHLRFNGVLGRPYCFFTLSLTSGVGVNCTPWALSVFSGDRSLILMNVWMRGPTARIRNVFHWSFL